MATSIGSVALPSCSAAEGPVDPTVRERVCHVIADQLGLALADLRADATIADLGAGSLDVFEIWLAIEEDFALSIEEGDLDPSMTVDALVRQVTGCVLFARVFGADF